MWWDWAEPLEIYLCRGLAWCRAPGHGLVRIRMPTTLALPAQLHRIAASLALKPGTARQLRIYLGSRMCPPVCFVVPDGLRWEEQGWIARKHAATVWGLGPADSDQLSCELSTSVAGLAAGLPTTTLQAIHGFAQELGTRLISLSPMWAECAPAQRVKDAGGYWTILKEPDGTILKLIIGSTGCESSFVEGVPSAGKGPGHTWTWNVVEHTGAALPSATDRARLVECFDKAAP